MDAPKRNNCGGKLFKKLKTRRERIDPRKTQNINVAEAEGKYAKVLKRLGGNQLRVMLDNGIEDTVVIPGRLYGKKRSWIRPDMIVLVNNENEIIKIMRDNDKDATLAHGAIGKIDKKNAAINIFQDLSDDDDEETLADIGILKQQKIAANKKPLIETLIQRTSQSEEESSDDTDIYINRNKLQKTSESTDEENSEEDEEDDENDCEDIVGIRVNHTKNNQRNINIDDI